MQTHVYFSVFLCVWQLSPVKSSWLWHRSDLNIKNPSNPRVAASSAASVFALSPSDHFKFETWLLVEVPFEISN